MSEHNALARLIDETRKANGWSDPQIVSRARAHGRRLSKSTISEIRTAGITTLVPDKIRAIADGLALPVSEVVRAALEAVGLPSGGPGNSVEAAVQRDVTLPLATKRAILAMIRDARRQIDVPSAQDIADAKRNAVRLEEERRQYIAAVEEAVSEQQLFPRLTGDPTQHSGLSGTAPEPTPTQADLDLAAADTRPGSTPVRDARAQQDRDWPDPEGPEDGA